MPRNDSNREPKWSTREREIIASLRRIMRAVDLHSRRLLDDHGLTGPQLATLHEVERRGRVSPASLAAAVHLSRPTVTGILTRLARRGLVERSPAPTDGRSVEIALTELGRQVLIHAPSLLQDRFRAELARLEDWEQLQLLATLKRIASMMDVADLDAAPHLVTRAEDLGAPVDPAANGAPRDPLGANPRAEP